MIGGYAAFAYGRAQWYWDFATMIAGGLLFLVDGTIRIRKASSTVNVMLVTTGVVTLTMSVVLLGLWLAIDPR